MDDILENAIIYLIRQDRFYAEMLHRMKKNWSTDIDTMGVAVDMNGVHLYVNPFFLKDLPVPEQAEVLKHECEHPLRGHFDREKTLAPSLYKDNQSLLDRYKNMTTAYMLNIAEDYSINETLPKLPAKFRIFDKEGKPLQDPEKGGDLWASPAKVDDLIAMFPEEKIERNQAFEYYYSFIKQKANEGKFSGKNKAGVMILPMDKHDMLSEALEQIDETFAKAIVNKLAQDAKDATPGRIPGHLEVAIDKLNKKVKDWRQDLQLFAAQAANSEEECTNRRRNRRYGLLYPGKRSKVKTLLAVPIDTSGSVSDKALTQFLSEIGAIADAGADVVVIECDAGIGNVYKYEPGTLPKVKGRGGTSFKPAFELVNSDDFIHKYGNVDGLIYLTDGDDYGDLVEEPNFPVLWALLPRCKVRYDWGQKITVEVN